MFRIHCYYIASYFVIKSHEYLQENAHLYKRENSSTPHPIKSPPSPSIGMCKEGASNIFSPPLLEQKEEKDAQQPKPKKAVGG